MRLIWLLLLVFCIIYEIKEVSSACGYEYCSLSLKSSKINVHIIPHSHDDVGWIKSFGEYFSGVHAGASVNNIISNVYAALKTNGDRTYTQVETAFFWKWWQLQTDEIKNGYKSLVENGQIEIANGGFTMNDEACVHYQSTIDQFTRGLRILNETLGSCGAPKVGWQIDPFGHSREQSLIYRQLGFDGAFFARLDYNDRNLRIDEKRLDFLWKSSPNFADSEIFYGILKNHYSSPQGFCYDIMCTDDEPINDDEDSFDYNADKIRDGFEKILDEFANSSTTNQILIPMGDDFNYESAAHQFMNIDRLIKLFDNHIKYNLFYSTPSCYLFGVHQSAPNLSVKTDDFFPYADNSNAYWTGYYTSRPTSKRFERTAHTILQANKHLRSIFKLNKRRFLSEDSDPMLEELQDSLAIMQHHDAISGTERQKVANDYVNMLNMGIIKSEKDVGVIIGTLLGKENQIYDSLRLSSCLLANVSICENSSKDRFIIAVYNPLSKSVSEAVRLPVQDSEYSIIGPDGKEIDDLEVVDTISNFSYISLKDLEPSAKELVFSAKQIPPLGINLYYVSKKTNRTKQTREINKDDNLVFGTKDLNFVLDSLTNKLKSITMNGITQSITQDFYYYPSETAQSFAPSGAYVFRPMRGTTEATKVSDHNAVLEYSYKGKLIDEAHVRINDWIKQIIRVYKGGEDNYIEFDWLVGPINIQTGKSLGREVISRFTVSDFANNGVFYTDSNGRETIKRVRNQRVDYTYNSTCEPISSNYYPVTARIAMRDEAKQLEVAVFNDRSQGGSSLNDGELEIMVHRRVLVDDDKGLSEALDEQEFDQPLVVRGKHYLMIGSTSDNNFDGKGISFTAAQRDFQSKKHLSPYVLVADTTDRVLTYDILKDILHFQMQFLTQPLPDNVNILTLERWRDEDDTYLLRLEHLLEKNEDLALSKSVTVDVGVIFGNNKIEEMIETTLGANVWLSDYNSRSKKFVWTTDTNKTVNSEMERSLPLASKTDTKITLLPMEIRTFIIKISS